MKRHRLETTRKWLRTTKRHQVRTGGVTNENSTRNALTKSKSKLGSVKERRVHEHINDEANSVDIIPTDETGTRETASMSTDANAQEQGGKEVKAEVCSDEPNVPDMNSDESHRPGNPTDPLHDAEEATCQTGKLELLTMRPGDVEAEPGGGIETDRNESIALESRDAKADGKVLWMHRDVQVEVEDPRMQGNVSIEGARERTAAHARSMTYVDEGYQHTLADVLTTSGSVEDDRKQSMKLSNQSEREHKCSKWRS